MARLTLFALAALIGVSAAHAQTLDGRLRKIADTKTITLAHRTDAAPFSFVDANRQIAGYSIDLCRRVVASIERQIKVPGLKVNYVPVTTQSRFDAIVKGEADLECGASTATLSRMKVVDFSSFIFLETTGLMAKVAGGYRSLADLSGKRIAVIGGTTNESAVNAQIKRRRMTITTVPVKTNQEGIAALEAGSVDAFASDALLLIGGLAQAKNPKALTLLNDKLSFEPYAIVLPRADYAFRLAVNTALAEIYSGDDINEIYNRWFGALGQPTPLTEAVYIFGSIPE
jgi:glutamate/aspartate transport system substrate-binding protein